MRLEDFERDNWEKGFSRIVRESFWLCALIADYVDFMLIPFHGFQPHTNRLQRARLVVRQHAYIPTRRRALLSMCQRIHEEGRGTQGGCCTSSVLVVYGRRL
jgi:hypothetical protein